MFFFNPIYFVFALPALLLGLYAQFKVRSAYEKYQRVRNAGNMSGFEAAQRLLAISGLNNVGIQETRGTLSDHYDPRNRTLYLSSGVGSSPSVASIGIVAHEVGHAIQHAQGYTPMKVRSAIVPAVQLGSWLGPIIFLAGFLLQLPGVPLVGLILFSTTLLFALVTLPVELNASHRAIGLLNDGHMISATEEKGVRAVLSAAALTYVAAVVQALSTILYYLFLLTGSRNRR